MKRRTVPSQLEIAEYRFLLSKKDLTPEEQERVKIFKKLYIKKRAAK